MSLEGQLLWREFYHCHGHANPYFDKMEESPTCLQVDWRWHTIPEKEEDMTDDDKLARSQFEAWKEGRTGFPWIDAIMIQLKEEGWMHHLARHSVACFLTGRPVHFVGAWPRGVPRAPDRSRLEPERWQLALAEQQLLLHCLLPRVLPIAFGKKWDPEGKFIKKYIPALKKFPAKYIYEPWKAPLTLQHAAGCRIGKDYPSPIVAHKEAMGRCLEGMKRSYANGQYGVPPAPKSPTRSSKKRPRSDSSEASE